MNLKYSFKTAFAGLRTNKSRAALTILGIVIGVAAVVLVISVGKGAEALILKQMKGLGAETIIIEPGREPKGPYDYAELFTDSLKEKDIKALLNPSNVKGLKDIMPVVSRVGTASYKNETIRTNIMGFSHLITEILEIYPDKGVFFDKTEIKNQAKVAVIGSKVKEKLFGESEAVGEKIKIMGKTFKVIGTTPSLGFVSFFDADDLISIPYTTAQKYLFGIDYYHAFIVRAESEKIVPRVAEEIKLTLRETHGITDPDKDDFHITTQEDMVRRVGIVTGIMTALLASVAAISLLVGGIGIMNIMLVSVAERTREIGLRKALGATNKNILVQFLLETITLTAIGGIIGIGLGAILSFAASLALSKFIGLNWTFTISALSIILGVGVSAFVGLVFGIYPARQAAKKSPIEALRYE